MITLTATHTGLKTFIRSLVKLIVTSLGNFLIYGGSHPDLQSKGSAEFMRIKAAYEQITSKSIVSVTKSQGQRRSYGHSYSGIRRPAQNAITLWGLCLATSFILVGTLLYWGRIGMAGSTYQKRPSRVIEAQPSAVTKKQIAALLIQKSKQKRDEN